MGSLIKAQIFSCEEWQPYGVPDPQDSKNDALRIRIPWKVFFLHDVDTLLIPKGPIGLTSLNSIQKAESLSALHLSPMEDSISGSSAKR